MNVKSWSVLQVVIFIYISIQCFTEIDIFGIVYRVLIVRHRRRNLLLQNVLASSSKCIKMMEKVCDSEDADIFNQNVASLERILWRYWMWTNSEGLSKTPIHFINVYIFVVLCCFAFYLICLLYLPLLYVMLTFFPEIRHTVLRILLTRVYCLSLIHI